MARPVRRAGNLPAESTSFVGRRRELAELKKKLTSVRLVSLVGPGGVGKTRLAIRVATDVGRTFPDGVWLVELAEVQDPELVGNAVVASLDLRDGRRSLRQVRADHLEPGCRGRPLPPARRSTAGPRARRGQNPSPDA